MAALLSAFAVMTVPWPRPLSAPAAFDEASRGEILQAWRAVAALPAGPWRARAQAQLRAGFAAAKANCAGAFCEVKSAEDAFTVPPELKAWGEASVQFHHDYWAEQERLGRLLPKTSSEILPVDPSESLGNAYPDKTFLLTFDDGPQATTAPTIDALKAGKVNGTFFVLGSNYTAAKAALYDGQCVGWHGDVHTPHKTEEHAKVSAAAGKALNFKLFRPPYGQRTPAVFRVFKELGFQLVLWNLDSQDWSPTMSVPQVEARMETLMLTKRHGIALFHDVHPKAKLVLPRLFARFKDAGLTYADCHTEIPPG
jgi:peptidoglycan/xylan/chitin deacetylase (PgdA/CDA1 family)